MLVSSVAHTELEMVNRKLAMFSELLFKAETRSISPLYVSLVFLW